ncbi:MAG: DUF4124 domain-containing protein [Rudaea sp.]|uniref:DUF4124 domain-containing protein n=1 Tax=unclassified Rudaea TaxID=2627037 RepID=UPI0010F49111|nr:MULTISPECIES: DUF4124 domain-containing protein [unclassified Rudaea]MBN8885965.1 DUF4124 domain-containing protein [Rudaea sp.]MBR0345072.1 DUF4124 domain-containing protein [Rudaea sp.]
MPSVRAALPRLAVMLALATVLASGVAAAAELYKWTDSKGVVHYSDTPPPKGGEAPQRLRLNGTESPTKPDPTAEQKAAAETEAGKAAEATPTTLPDTPENRKRFCEQAQAQLDLLQSKFQVADSNGKPLDDKTRAERTAQAKQAATTYCQNPS